MDTSDLAINSSIRRVLARHFIDLPRVRFGCFRGTVRMRGELVRRQTAGSGSLEASTLHAIEEEIHRIRGVQRLHVDIRNWQRLPGGGWVAAEAPEGGSPILAGEPESSAFVVRDDGPDEATLRRSAG